MLMGPYARGLEQSSRGLSDKMAFGEGVEAMYRYCNSTSVLIIGGVLLMGVLVLWNRNGVEKERSGHR
jgi:hypothetical protein